MKAKKLGNPMLTRAADERASVRLSAKLADASRFPGFRLSQIRQAKACMPTETTLLTRGRRAAICGLTMSCSSKGPRRHACLAMERRANRHCRLVDPGWRRHRAGRNSILSVRGTTGKAPDRIGAGRSITAEALQRAYNLRSERRAEQRSAGANYLGQPEGDWPREGPSA